jgi:hypothetical protein
MMTEERYNDIKEGYINNIKRFIVEVGDIFPHVTVFGLHKDDQTKNAIIHIPIDDEFMKSEERKETFINDVVPEVARKIKEQFIPEGVAWTSEAWLRESPVDKGIPNDWKELPVKKEVLFINMEFEHKKEMIVYEIKRLGKQVTEDGEIVDQVELIEQDFSKGESSGGRLTGLYEKFINA